MCIDGSLFLSSDIRDSIIALGKWGSRTLSSKSATVPLLSLYAALTAGSVGKGEGAVRIA